MMSAEENNEDEIKWMFGTWKQVDKNNMDGVSMFGRSAE